MADPKAENNVQHFLAKIAGVDTSTPTPQTNVEHYLAKIAGEDVAIPEKPSTTEEYYLDKIVKGGVGVEVVPLNVIENGTYTAEEGQAYSPVIVNVAGVKVLGPFGPYKVGDRMSTQAVQSLLTPSNPSMPYVCIATDGSRFAALVSYDGTTYTFKRANTAENVEFSITRSGTTITAMSGANELTWWRTLEVVPIETVTGIIATFETNMAIKLKECKADIEPVQAGSGDPSPDNVRPISGWTVTKVTRTGKNMFPSEWEDGTIAPTTGEPINDPNYFRVQKIKVEPNKSYYLSFDGSVASANEFRYFTYDENGNFGSAIGITAPRIINTGSNRYLSFRWLKSYELTNFQFELSSTVTEYEPYQGTTYSITFPSEAGAVYGGTLDVTNGVLTVDRAMVDLGALNWGKVNYFSTNDIANQCEHPVSNNIAANAICSIYPVVARDSLINKSISIQADGAIVCNDETYTDATSFKTAMNGVQFVFELAAHTTYHLTSTEITTLLGQNNIWADTGNIEVKYYAI